ncbi:YegS/Rv2252/BmrU family lipid kinase [[Phormidium] sp. LEGE 05292]|uniref:YegS/Rv2252/BmrU family lipid kinase n=1 Tax=[Phormidium] sp. LEGE 05292 TaxID=767427 RepID=UPI001D136663|nr:YegS/Rv2252/BmrU family lipid kinase [Phormidium sp. LEGE 05292]
MMSENNLIETESVQQTQRYSSACLIFNPVSGRGNPDGDLELIKSILESELELDIQFTSEEVSAKQLAREALEKNVKLVIASGGDGTVSAVADALINSEIPLAVIPRGTANAFAVSMGIPTNIEGACQAILEGVTRVISTARCNGEPMLLLAGIGLEAETVAQADRTAKNRLGILAYILSAINQLKNLQSFETKLERDEEVISFSAVGVTVANVAPPTSILAQGPASLVPDDEFLDVTIFAPVSVLNAIAASYHLLQTAFSGTPTERNDIGYLRVKKALIDTDPPQKVVVDGEVIGTTPVFVEAIPNSLMVLVPQSQAAAPVEKLNGLPNLTIEPKENNNLSNSDSEYPES